MKKDFDGILFKLHDLGLAVDALKVREVIGGAVWREGHLGEGTGSIETRGRVLPVIDLRQTFGFPGLEKSGMNSFIAVQTGEGAGSPLAALWVDSLLDMVHVPAMELREPIPAGELPAQYLQSAFDKDGNTIYVIRTEAIVTDELVEAELDKAAS